MMFNSAITDVTDRITERRAETQQTYLSRMKVSAVAPEHRIVKAPVRVFEDLHSVSMAFRARKNLLKML